MILGIQVERTADELEAEELRKGADLAAQTISSVYRTWAAVNAALGRIPSGRYEVCEDCGRQIHQNRLKTIPWAALCVTCQEEADRQTDDRLVA